MVFGKTGFGGRSKPGNLPRRRDALRAKGYLLFKLGKKKNKKRRTM